MFSFVFYTPTYLIVLSIYSLCRVDDISWGTKGLNAATDKDESLRGAWRLLKYVQVAKFVFWNVIVSCMLMFLNSFETARFVAIFGVLIIITGSVSLKVLIAMFYLVKYLIRNYCGPQNYPVCETFGCSSIQKKMEDLGNVNKIFAREVSKLFERYKKEIIPLLPPEVIVNPPTYT